MSLITRMCYFRAKDDTTELSDVCFKVGQNIALLHNGDVIHGDLTSSNLLVQEHNNSLECVVIDFGLSSSSTLIEDKGVDLYVLEKAFLSSHPNSEKLFERLLEGYCKVAKEHKAVINKLAEIRLRGRKRSMVG